MENLPAKPVAVMGSDIDLQTAKGLTSGDTVLVEINGERIFGSGYSNNPVLADMPWTVEDNDDAQMVLSHPFHSCGLTLHYRNVRPSYERGPAVFVEFDPKISSDENGDPLRIVVILQHISCYLPEDVAKSTFTNSYDPSYLTDPDNRDAVIQGLVKGVKRLKSGWRYVSKCRFAMRSGVSLGELDQLVSGELQSDEQLNRIGREFGWMNSNKQATTVLEVAEEYRSEAEDEKGEEVCRHG